MAGRRRTRAAGRAVEPTLRAGRPLRRREALAARWAMTRTATERAVVAAGYLQGARSRRQPDPALTASVDREAEQIARRTVELADRLLGLQATEPLTPPDPGRGHAP